MKRLRTIEKASRIDFLEDEIIAGVDLDADGNGLVSHGNSIIRLKKSDILDTCDIKYFYFMSFVGGVLYYEKEGAPIFHYDFSSKTSQKITNNDCYFSPTQIRSSINHCVLVQMDEQFNQSYYLLNSDFEKMLLPQFPKILLKNNFLFYDKSLVENYSLSTLELQWKLEIDSSNQVERRNQGNAVFSDGKYVFVRLKGGKLVCVSLETGLKVWELENEIEQVSFGEVDESLYINFGHGFNEVDKKTGNITRSFLYKGVGGLESFSSNGIIWCFENLIVTRNSFTGDLAVFKRSDFNLIERVVVDEAGIPESKDCIRYQDGCLYVLSSSSTAYIFQIEL